MNYLSAYLWQQDKADFHNSVSLVFQHAKVKKRDVILACVCESCNKGEEGVTESGYFSEGLTEWFHREGVRLCAVQAVGEVPGERLYEEVERLEKETAVFLQRSLMKPGLHYWGMLLCESKAWFFAKGECRGLLLNRRFLKKNVREILPQNKMQGICKMTGRVQRKLGILICSRGFVQGISMQMIGEGLIPEEDFSEERMSKRLWELWQAGGSNTVGVIYLRS